MTKPYEHVDSETATRPCLYCGGTGCVPAPEVWVDQTDPGGRIVRAKAKPTPPYQHCDECEATGKQRERE